MAHLSGDPFRPDGRSSLERYLLIIVAIPLWLMSPRGSRKGYLNKRTGNHIQAAPAKACCSTRPGPLHGNGTSEVTSHDAYQYCSWRAGQVPGRGHDFAASRGSSVGPSRHHGPAG